VVFQEVADFLVAAVAAVAGAAGSILEM